MASPKVRWGEAKKLEDMRKSTERTWQDFTEMRTGFVSPLTLSVTATSLESYQWMNLQKGLPRTALSFHFKELRACKVREWRESRHTAWEADTHAQPGWWEYEFGSSAPVHRQTDLPWDFSGCSLQGIPFLLVARNRQQLKSPGSPVAASWSYRSWWEASGDRQHQAREKLSLPNSRGQRSESSGPGVLGGSSQYPDHWAIMSSSSWRSRYPLVASWTCKSTPAAGSPKLSPTLGGRGTEARWCWNPTPFPSQPSFPRTGDFNLQFDGPRHLTNTDSSS